MVTNEQEKIETQEEKIRQAVKTLLEGTDTDVLVTIADGFCTDHTIDLFIDDLLLAIASRNPTIERLRFVLKNSSAHCVPSYALASEKLLRHPDANKEDILRIVTDRRELYPEAWERLKKFNPDFHDLRLIEEEIPGLRKEVRAEMQKIIDQMTADQLVYSFVPSLCRLEWDKLKNQLTPNIMLEMLRIISWPDTCWDQDYIKSQWPGEAGKFNVDANFILGEFSEQILQHIKCCQDDKWLSEIRDKVSDSNSKRAEMRIIERAAIKRLFYVNPWHPYINSWHFNLKTVWWAKMKWIIRQKFLF